MDMGKETYSKYCKDAQIHVHIEVKKKIIKVCVVTSQQTAQYGGVLGG